MPKTCEQRFYNHIRVVVCKKPREKTPNIGQNSQNWPRGEGYRLRKIATLGQKLKMPQTCEKRFYNHIRVVVCEKPCLLYTSPSPRDAQ